MVIFALILPAHVQLSKKASAGSVKQSILAVVDYLEKGYYSFTQPFEAFPKSLQGAFFCSIVD